MDGFRAAFAADAAIALLGAVAAWTLIRTDDARATMRPARRPLGRAAGPACRARTVARTPRRTHYNSGMADDAGGIVYGTMLVADAARRRESRPGDLRRHRGRGRRRGPRLLAGRSYSGFAGERARAGEAFTLSGSPAGARPRARGDPRRARPARRRARVLGGRAQSLSTAVSIAVGVAIATIVATELALGLRSEHTGRELAGPHRARVPCSESQSSGSSCSCTEAGLTAWRAQVGRRGPARLL